MLKFDTVLLQLTSDKSTVKEVTPRNRVLLDRMT
jgi:hypothetical protein